MRALCFPGLVLIGSLSMLGCPGDDATGDGDTGAATGATTDADGSGSAGEETAADGTGTGGQADGEMVYATLCSGCHGAEGQGTELGYELRHPVRDFSTWVVRNGRPGDEFESSSMTAYPEGAIDDATLEQIWDYLDAFPQPTTGEDLYLDYCRNCHGVDARGGVVNKDISDKTYADAYERVRDGAGLGDVGARLLYMPAFGTDVLSDAELQLVMDHVAAL